MLQSTSVIETPMSNIKIHESWKNVLADVFESINFEQIRQFLYAAKQSGKLIYPPGNLIFNAFDSTPFDEVKVVLLGQDPYHGPGQAMGLSFSVPAQMPVPASLRNVYKELADDLDLSIPTHGDLSSWARQGVLMLNAILTVEAGKAGSHKDIGWQQFTDSVIRKLSADKEGLVFLLWGNFARGKKSLIDEKKHFVLESPHPSP